MLNYVLKWGLILSGINIALTMLAYLLNMELLVTWWYGLLIFVLNIVLIVFISLKFRNLNGGYLTFKEAFLVTFGTMAAAGFVAIFFNILLYHVIDPELPGILQEMVINKTVSMMEKFNVDESIIEQTMDEMEAQSQFSLNKQLLSFIWVLLFDAVVALIIAAIIKKNKPLFSEEA